MRVLHTIELGEGKSVELREMPINQAWVFCRNGDPVRWINRNTLEHDLLEHIKNSSQPWSTS